MQSDGPHEECRIVWRKQKVQTLFPKLAVGGKQQKRPSVPTALREGSANLLLNVAHIETDGKSDFLFCTMDRFSGKDSKLQSGSTKLLSCSFLLDATNELYTLRK